MKNERAFKFVSRLLFVVAPLQILFIQFLKLFFVCFFFSALLKSRHHFFRCIIEAVFSTSVPGFPCCFFAFVELTFDRLLQSFITTISQRYQEQQQKYAHINN